jgi:para-nitrobenzyl esterase
MRTLAFTAAALALFALPAAAQAPTAEPPIPAAPGAMSVEKTTIGDLLENPGSKAVLEKDFPKLVSYPGLDQIRGMTLRDIEPYPEAELTEAKLAAIQADLDAAAKP